MNKWFLFPAIFLVSCASMQNQTSGTKINQNANQQLFAMKGYQPIDPISINTEHLSMDSIVYLFPNEATRVAVGRVNQSGSLAFGSNTLALKGQSYTIIIDYVKYKTTSIPARYSFENDLNDKYLLTKELLETKFGSIADLKSTPIDTTKTQRLQNANKIGQDIRIPVYVGIGLRIQSNVTILSDSLNINLGSLYNLGVAASQNKLSGTLIIQTLGISGTQISSAIPIPDKINESTIQNAITSLATIKSKIYDKDTKIYPQVVGFGLSYNIEGAKDLIEASLHSMPPKIKSASKSFIDFEEYVMEKP